METCQVKSAATQGHDWVVYRLGGILGSVGHRVKIHKITPTTDKELGHAIDSGIDLSITIDKLRVFINKTLSILSPYQ